jgi:glycine cleavage system H lipoate-binding protein
LGVLYIGKYRKRSIYMVAIIVLATFALIIVIRLYIDARKKDVPARAGVGVEQAALSRFFHPGYTWIEFNKPTSAAIGIVGFVKELMGNIDGIQFPQKGTILQEGDALFTLRHKQRTVTIYSPLSGRVEETREVKTDSRPQDNGWMVRLIPSNPHREFRNLMNSSSARIWQDALRMQLAQLFAPKLGPVLQDGGMLIPDFVDTLNEEEWNKVQKEFFRREL